MSQRDALVALLFFVVLSFGGLILYDSRYGHKVGKYIGREKPSNNWKWDDNWDGPGHQPGQPLPPPRQAAPPPRQQEVAGSYAEALKRSGETGTPVLAFFTADWCNWCKKMRAETLADQSVAAEMARYVTVYVDADKERAVASKFGVESLPSYVITNYKEEKLKVGSGYKNAGSFRGWLQDPSLQKQPKRPANDKDC